jgi:excisionase family DNA binding protein
MSGTEAAAYIGASAQTLYRIIREERMSVIQVSPNRKRISTKALPEFVGFGQESVPPNAQNPAAV